jgi:hypothetical protein
MSLRRGVGGVSLGLGRSETSGGDHLDGHDLPREFGPERGGEG